MAVIAACTRKSLQELDHADVHALRARDSHASGGVVSLLSRCVAPCFYFFLSFVARGFKCGYLSSGMLVATRQWIARDPSIYTIHLFTSERSRLVCEPPPGHIRAPGSYMSLRSTLSITIVYNWQRFLISRVILHYGLYKMTFGLRGIDHFNRTANRVESLGLWLH